MRVLKRTDRLYLDRKGGQFGKRRCPYLHLDVGACCVLLEKREGEQSLLKVFVHNSCILSIEMIHLVLSEGFAVSVVLTVLDQIEEPTPSSVGRSAAATRALVSCPAEPMV